MNLKLAGALLVFAGCGGLGFFMAMGYKKELAALRELAVCLDYMSCELAYRMTPLPEICDKIGSLNRGCIGTFFCRLSQELRKQIFSNAPQCVNRVLECSSEIPDRAGSFLSQLGSTLGQFDMEGQLKQIETLKKQVENESRNLEKGRSERIRSYQTLGLCAGAALAIILM